MNFLFFSSTSVSMLILFISVLNLSNAYYHYVVMKAESTVSSNDFCIYSEVYPFLPKQVAEAKPRTLEIGSAVDWCTNDSKSNASDKVLLLPSGNCSLPTQIQNFNHVGGKVILFINNGSLRNINFIECEYLKGTGIPAMKISKSSANVLKEMGEIITVKLFQPSAYQGVYFLVILGTLAVFTAAVGSYLSGLTGYKIYTFTVCNKKIVFSSLSMILYIISFGVAIVWLIFRNTKHAWVLQNILCMFLCFGFLRLLRFSSLKACTVLLLLLFIFDIFLVIITPLFTKNGNSVMGEVATAGNMEKLKDPNVMEEVAAGRNYIEFMPAILKVKDIGFHPLGACVQPFAAVGLGDIVLPGLLLSYCYAFDICSNKKMIYYPTSVIFYGIGIIISNLAMVFWKSEQPALLFVVPSVLIPIVLLGWFRGELSTLWHGLEVINKTYDREAYTIDGQNSIS